MPLIGCLLFHCSKCELKKCDRPKQAERQSCLNETEKKINTTKRVKMKRGRNIESFFIKKSSQDTGDGPWEDANWPRSFGDSIIDSEPEETTESEIEPGPETQINKPKMYSFRHDWLTQFPWLRYDKGRNAMHCIYCRECGQIMAGNTAFVGEATAFRIETLKKHNMSKKHTICRDKCVDKVAPLPAAFQRQAVVIRSSEESEMIIKCNVAYNIAKEEMPFTTFKSEIILMKKNGLNVNPTYSNDTACAQFIGVIGDTLKKKDSCGRW